MAHQRGVKSSVHIGALSVELTPDDLREIDGAAAKITVQGARYPEKLENDRPLIWPGHR
jgi:hypothetical protein